MVRVMTCALSQTVRFAPLEVGAVADIARLRLVSISLLKSTGVWLLLATFVISNTARGSLTNTTGQLFKDTERPRNDITHVFYQCVHVCLGSVELCDYLTFAFGNSYENHYHVVVCLEQLCMQ